MQSSLFIVWRESVEALLVIGILYNWIKRENISPYIKFLWAGTAAGLLISALLAVLFWIASNWYAGAGGEWLFVSMMAASALLILHMVVWMHHNGSNMKKTIEYKAQKSLNSGSQGWGIMTIAMLAVAREGSETVVFLSGIGAQQTGLGLLYFIIGGVIGFFLALLSFGLLQKFANAISWKYFFLISEFILLLIGGALFVNACDKASGQLANYNIPDWLYNFMANPIWNSSNLIPDSSTLTSLTGYHATPSIMQITALICYWLLAIWLCNKGKFNNILHIL